MSRPRRINRHRPLLVVLSAPSGAGKSTIVDLLVKGNRHYCKSISATTRSSRRGERRGRDYFFLTETEFRNKARQGEFIEMAKVFREYYGTPKDYVLSAEAKGKTVLFDIDVQGGMSVKKWRRDAVLIFIVPPSLKELQRRLRDRKTETKEAQKLRLARALKEIGYWTKYDYVVCNDNLEQCVSLVESIIEAESQRSSRIETSDLEWER